MNDGIDVIEATAEELMQLVRDRLRDEEKIAGHFDEGERALKELQRRAEAAHKMGEAISAITVVSTRRLAARGLVFPDTDKDASG